MINFISVALGSAWGRLGGTSYEGIHKQMLRSGFNPLQISLVKLYEWWADKSWWCLLLLIIYWVWQWGMLQAFSYGKNNPLNSILEKCFSGTFLDYMKRLICAMFWCLPSILFCFFVPFWHWGLFYIIGIILIPLIGTFIKSADWNEMLVWGVFTTQVFI